MRNIVNILGVKIDNVNMEQAVEKVKGFLLEDKKHIICTPNAEIMMKSHRDSVLKYILNYSNLVIADGAGVVLASKILGDPLPERVAGYDLLQNILRLKLDKKIKVFLLGGKPNIAKQVIKDYTGSCEGIEFVGENDGYFTREQEEEIINRINLLKTDILLVALGAPKQEKWMYKNRDKLKVKICMGVGGSFDVMAGKVTRAPEFFQKNGLEWLYRLYKEPKRFVRMLDLPLFIILVVIARIVREVKNITK